MSFNDTRNAIEARMVANYSTYKVKFENTKFKPPVNTPWLALTVQDGEAFNASIGTARRVQRHPGIIQVDIYVPENQGTKTSREIADAVAVIFNTVQFSLGSSGTISTRAPALQGLGIEEGWDRKVLSIPFIRDVIA